jgi:hypothetical protein
MTTLADTLVEWYFTILLWHNCPLRFLDTPSLIGTTDIQEVFRSLLEKITIDQNKNSKTKPPLGVSEGFESKTLLRGSVGHLRVGVTLFYVTAITANLFITIFMR